MNNDLTEVLEVFTHNRFPREVGKKLPDSFVRNTYVRNVEELASFVEDDRTSKDRFVTVYSFKGDFEEGKRWDRNTVVIDRLFIDIDSDDLRVSLAETKRLVRRLLRSSIVPIVMFSAGKGFHVHVLFEPVELKIPSALKKFGTHIVTKYSLQHADPSVFERARLCRLPHTINSKTNLRTVLLHPRKLLGMSVYDVIRQSKANISEFEEPSYADWDYDLIVTDELLADEIERSKQDEGTTPTPIPAHAPASAPASAPAPMPTSNGEISPFFRRKRIAEYILAMQQYGQLTRDPAIARIHSSSEFYRACRNPGALEHTARVYFVNLLIEEGYSDEDIHRIFRFAKDYNPEVTQRFIDYNRRRKMVAVSRAPVPQPA